MGSIDKCFDILLTGVCAASSVLFDENFDFNRLLMVYLEEEQLQLLLVVLEPSN